MVRLTRRGEIVAMILGIVVFLAVYGLVGYIETAP